MYPHVTQFETNEQQVRDEYRLRREREPRSKRPRGRRRAFALAFTLRRRVGASQ